MYIVYFSTLLFLTSPPGEGVLPLTEDGEIMTLHLLYRYRVFCKNFSQGMIWTDFLIFHGEQIVKYKVKILPASMMGNQASQLTSCDAWFIYLPGPICLPCVLMFNSNSSFSSIWEGWDLFCLCLSHSLGSASNITNSYEYLLSEWIMEYIIIQTLLEYLQWHKENSFMKQPVSLLEGCWWLKIFKNIFKMSF